MRLGGGRVLYVWRQLTPEFKDRAAEIERRVQAVQRTPGQA